MKIQLNNRVEIFSKESMTVKEILEQKNFSFRMLVVKVNGQLIRKSDYESTLIHDGDEVMVLHLISGG